MLNLGMMWSGGPVYVAHKVYPDQLERDPVTGKLKIGQPDYHKVWLFSMNLNINARLGLTRWWDVRLTFPLRFVSSVVRFEDSNGKELPDFNSIHHRNEVLVGLGDPTLQTGFRPIALTSTQRWLFEFGGGLSLPLGRTEPDPYKAGREGREHQHIVFGSGTFDPMGFVTLGYMGRKFQIYLDSSIRGSLYQNQYGFQEGLRIQAGLTGETSFGLKKWSFPLGVSLLVQRAGLWSGEADREGATGRIDMLLSTGVFWRPTASWQVAFRVSVPINLYIDAGGELVSPVILSLGFNYQFRLFGGAKK